MSDRAAESIGTLGVDANSGGAEKPSTYTRCNRKLLGAFPQPRALFLPALRPTEEKKRPNVDEGKKER